MTLTVDVARFRTSGHRGHRRASGPNGPVPRSLGLARARLAEYGFEGKLGQTLVLPAGDGAPSRGRHRRSFGPHACRGAAARRGCRIARAAGKRTSLATSLADTDSTRAAAQAVVEGVALATYRFTDHKTDKGRPGLGRLVLIVGADHARGRRGGATRGLVTAAPPSWHVTSPTCRRPISRRAGWPSRGGDRRVVGCRSR